ncbi:MAG: hypothetical protein IJ757_07970 [Clostridiales bacterium]|nr:hypothetical protein [Clostridiales bacterium]
MKFETNLSKKDKLTIAAVLFIGAVFMFVWFLIRPTITDIKSLGDDIEQAEAVQTNYRNKLINLTSAEAVYGKVVTDLSESTSDFYEIMPSSGIDRMITTYILGFGLYPEDLYINMPSGPVEETPYMYSDIASAQASAILNSSSGDASTAGAGGDNLFAPYNQARSGATSTSASGVQCAAVTMVMTGSQPTCQALIDDLCTKPSVRITGFEWMPIDQVEQYNEETGMMEYVESDQIRLRVSINLYMADIADYDAAVADAAGAEG